VVRPQADPSPLRSDIAAFVGPTRRGPIGVPVRVEGWREYVRAFGDLDRDLDTPYAIRGYFENGGEVAWIVRLAAPGANVSTATWTAKGLGGLGFGVFRISAASPGSWSRGTRVALRYRGRTPTGAPTVDVSIRTGGNETEEHRAIPAADFVARLRAQSRLVTVEQIGAVAPSTPRGFATDTVTLDSAGAAASPELEDYLDAIGAVIDIPEAAIVGFPSSTRSARSPRRA